MISLKRITIVFSLLAFILSGCDMMNEWGDDYKSSDSIIGSGHLVQIEKSFEDFTKINAAHSFDITLIESDEYSINIELDDNIVEYLEVYKVGSTLNLRIIGNHSFSNVTLRAVITMPMIEFVGLSGACKINLAGFEMDRSTVFNLSGASKVTGELICADLSLNLSGASYVELEGACDELTIYGSGASNIYILQFQVSDAVVYLSGASFLTINVSDNLSAYLSGASILYYSGNPNIEILEMSGTSYIRRI